MDFACKSLRRRRDGRRDGPRRRGGRDGGCRGVGDTLACRRTPEVQRACGGEGDPGVELPVSELYSGMQENTRGPAWW